MRFFLLLSSLAFFLLLPETLLAEQRKITLATHNLCPYGCYENDGDLDGSAVRVVKYALSRMNCEGTILVVPWKRAQRMSIEGDADGFFGASQSDERDKEGTLSEIIADQQWTWYLLKTNPLDPTDRDFRGKAMVAAFGGSNMLNWLKKNNYNIIASPPSTRHLLNMLLYGRFDAMLANDQSMKHYIQELGLQDKLKSHTCMNKPLGVYFSKRFTMKSPEFVDEFNLHVREYLKTFPLAP